MTWIIDIETDGLLDTLSTVWVICGLNTETGQEVRATGTDIPKFLEEIKNETIVAHNGIGFDLPALEKLYGWVPEGQVYDTYILSQLFYPNEMLQYGLESWGKLLKFPKGDHSDWTKLSQEMIDYCMQDVRLTAKVWEICRKELDSHDWDRAVELEQKHYEVFARNCTHWYVDMDMLQHYIKLLTRYISFAERKLKTLTPMQVYPGSEVKLHRKDGQISAAAAKFSQKSGISIFNIVGDFCKVSIEEMNLNSNKQVTDWLLSIGWEPDEYNYKVDEKGKEIIGEDGNPIISSPKLSGSTYSGIPESIGYPLRQHSKASTRLSNLKGFQRAAYDIQTYEDGRTLGKIPTFAYTCGTNTARYRHSLVVNIPKAGSGVFFGDQMRSLFTVIPGYVLVGADAAAIEARIEGHYTSRYDGGEYARELLEEDIHTKNANSWGLSRQDAKAPYYALSYQAGPKKISKMLGIDQERARTIWLRYWEDRPALKQLVQDLEAALLQRGFARKQGHSLSITNKRAWIKGVDGRKLFVRSAHSLKNTLIQNCGAVMLKYAAIIADSQIREQGIDARIVMNYHDELDVMVKVGSEEAVSKILEDAWEAAGRQYELNIPIIGEAKVGRNWAECH